jgi:hypothetical protein
MFGIAIHCQSFLSPNVTNNMCLECTFVLDNLVDAHPTLQNFLFTSECILACLTCSQSNVVVCKLDDSCIEGYESVGFSLSRPQQNFQYPQQNMQYLSQFGPNGVWDCIGVKPIWLWIVRAIVNLRWSCSITTFNLILQPIYMNLFNSWNHLLVMIEQNLCIT